MAKRFTVTYARRSPFAGVSLPGVDPGITLGRGNSAEIDEGGVKALRSALKSGALPGLTDEHFVIQEVTEAEPEPEAEPGPLAALGDEKTEGLLANAGFDTPEKLAAATDEELDQIEGVGPKTIEKIREAFPAAAQE